MPHTGFWQAPLAGNPAEAELRGRARVQPDHGALARTLKEECLYVHDFGSLDEARRVIRESIERYHGAWLLERHGHRTLSDGRASLTKRAP